MRVWLCTEQRGEGGEGTGARYQHESQHQTHSRKWCISLQRDINREGRHSDLEKTGRPEHPSYLSDKAVVVFVAHIVVCVCTSKDGTWCACVWKVRCAVMLWNRRGRISMKFPVDFAKSCSRTFNGSINYNRHISRSTHLRVFCHHTEQRTHNNLSHVPQRSGHLQRTPSARCR